GHCADGRLGRMAGHRSGVAQAEVDVFVPVDVREARAVRFRREDREATRPADHPRHRHAAQQRPARLDGQLAGARMLALETLELAVEERLGAHRVTASALFAGGPGVLVVLVAVAVPGTRSRWR